MPLYNPSTGGGGGAVASVNGRSGTVTGLVETASNLSDLASAGTARTNLGLGGAAVLAVGTTTGTVAAGDDTRLPTTAQKATLAAMPPLLLIASTGALPAGTAAGTVVVVQA